MSIIITAGIQLESKERIVHAKASEEYLQVRFTYSGDLVKYIWLPVEYRRTGVSIPEGDDEALRNHLLFVYDMLNPDVYTSWLQEQEVFWFTKSRADITKSFFDVLKDGQWHCVSCSLPQNPNWARRIQDLKEFGYTLATDTSKYCKIEDRNKTHIMLLPLPRVSNNANGYEMCSPQLKERIVHILGSWDAFEGKPNKYLSPVHKFSKIRWDENTKEENLAALSEEQIKEKFQLLSNQRNQQKREVCRNCFRTGKRGYPFGIPFFYAGDENWDPLIPITGKDAEKGCVGCGWYDFSVWRSALVQVLSEKQKELQTV